MFPTNLKDCVGVRGRMAMKNVVLPEKDTDEEIEFALDSLIRNEVALECAYEGKRYFVLMRSAQRWEKPEIMSNTLSAKFTEDERDAYKALLMDPANWYLKQNPRGEN